MATVTSCEYELPTFWRGRKQAVTSARIRRHYRERVGAIPDGYQVHHACGDPACTNPDHLMAVPPAQHVREDRYHGLAGGFSEVF